MHDSDSKVTGRIPLVPEFPESLCIVAFAVGVNSLIADATADKEAKKETAQDEDHRS